MYCCFIACGDELLCAESLSVYTSCSISVLWVVLLTRLFAGVDSLGLGVFSKTEAFYWRSCLDARGLAGGKNVSRLSHSSNKLPNLSAQHCKRGVPAIIEVTHTKGHHQSMGNRGLSTDEMGRLLAPLSCWRQRTIYICQDTSFGPIVSTPKVIT